MTDTFLGALAAGWLLCFLHELPGNWQRARRTNVSRFGALVATLIVSALGPISMGWPK